MMLNNVQGTQYWESIKPEKDLGAKRQKSKRRKPKANSMRVCPTCGRVWSYYHDGNCMRLKVYIDMPKYGLAKLECPECEGTK